MTSNTTTGGAAVVPVVMESKIPRETYRLIWNIANFAEVEDSKELLQALSVTFEMGRSIGLPVTFQAYLQVEEDEEAKGWRGCHLKLVKAPEGLEEEVIVKVVIKIENYREFTNKESTMKLKYAVGDEWGWDGLIPENEDMSNLPLDANQG